MRRHAKPESRAREDGMELMVQVQVQGLELAGGGGTDIVAMYGTIGT